MLPGAPLARPKCLLSPEMSPVWGQAGAAGREAPRGHGGWVDALASPPMSRSFQLAARGLLRPSSPYHRGLEWGFRWGWSQVQGNRYF